ncbi:MAG: c-type cytochrome [Acidobacteria bacterium]|nr:c-type cytochrome [Acidobacteriota bacterium]
MKGITSFALALAAAFVVATAILAAQNPGAAPAAANAQAAPKGSAENGKKVFSSYGCYECHGYAAQGGGAGPRLAPRPIAFTAFSKYVRLPTGQMPPYTSKVVSDQELADIFAFLSSIPAAPAANTIPILTR